MNTLPETPPNGFDRINAALAFFVLVFTTIIYALTVQPTLSFWDCGEFLACAYTLGIPHPPGSPVFVVIGRFFAMLPLASDICLRMNLLSVISSAFMAFFGYLLIVRIIRSWFSAGENDLWSRLIVYIGGVTGALFMAFSQTNWANAVEAEVYGLSMMLLTMIFWLALIYFEKQGTAQAGRVAVLMCFLGMLGVGVHLTTFLIMPVAAMFLILRRDASPREWTAIGIFFMAELLCIMLFADGRGGYPMFLIASLILLAVIAAMVYRHVNWALLIAIGAFSMIMIGFYEFMYGMAAGAVGLIILGKVAPKPFFDWKKGLVIILIVLTAFSFHLFIPIRSALSPRIDENKVTKEKFTMGFFLEPVRELLGTDDVFSESSRTYRTFVAYLERKQYGGESMVERMFHRRGTWENQFGHHANMGFWSYFEEQYGFKKGFLLFFILGMFGIYTAVKKKAQYGVPFFIFILLSSAGLVLYMNFADGLKYDITTNDAYLEVRNRDYFFTPAYTFFGLALGLGLAAVMSAVRNALAAEKFAAYRRPAMAGLALLTLLPTITLADNWYECDRSQNYYPRIYAENILNSCEKDAILFTSGDNDTFPLWCVQEVYDFRKDVTIINLSLLNTDWYIYQMKYQYGMPISLTEEQILWYPIEFQGQAIQRPQKPFPDRPRKRMTYLVPMQHEGRVVKLQDMMVDEIIIENRWQKPIYGTAEPYDESPLNLNNYTFSNGVVYQVDKNKPEFGIDSENAYRLYKEVYQYDGLDNPHIYRDENATGVFLSLGFNALRLAGDFQRQGDTMRAREVLEFISEKYPEFLQAKEALAGIYYRLGDSARAVALYESMEQYLTMLHDKNPGNQFYLQDLGMTKYHLGKTDEAVAMLWDAFDINRNSGFTYRRLVELLYETKRYSDILRATQMFAEYKINLGDPLVQQVLSATQSAPMP